VLQAASCKRVIAVAVLEQVLRREFSRVKFPRCSRKEIARNNEAKEE